MGADARIGALESSEDVGIVFICGNSARFHSLLRSARTADPTERQCINCCAPGTTPLIRARVMHRTLLASFIGFSPKPLSLD